MIDLSKRSKCLKKAILFILTISFVLLSVSTLTACISIPAQSAELSAELGSKIADSGRSHTAIVSSYFDQQRELVERFINERYIPVVVEEIFADPAVKEIWDEIVTTGNPDDRNMFFITFSPEIVRVAGEQRAAMFAQIQNLEQKLVSALQDNYSEMLYINGALTALLLSAAELNDRRELLFNRAGISNSDVLSVFDKIDQATQVLSDYSSTASDVLNNYADIFK